MDGDQCPGCGSMRGCTCTPPDIRAQLVADRAELSNRAASYMARANVAARLLRATRDLVPEGSTLSIEIDNWLA